MTDRQTDRQTDTKLSVGINAPKKRLLWVDIARGLAFIMVIYSHLQYCNSDIMVYLSPVFLTTFFFISGYLFNGDSSLKATIEARFRTLLLPWLFWGALLILSTSVITLKSEQPPLASQFLNMFLQIRGSGDTLWFIAALFVISIPFSFMVRYIKSTKKLLVSAIVLLVLSWLYSRSNPILYWHADRIGYGCFYMALGYIYRIKEDKLIFIHNNYMMLILLIAYVSMIFMRGLFVDNNYISYAGSKYLIDAIVITLTGLALIVWISKKLETYLPIITFVGANSLLYFALHGKCYSVTQTIFNKLFSILHIQSSIMINLLMAIITTSLCVLLLIYPIKFINKYMKFSIGRGFKLF